MKQSFDFKLFLHWGKGWPALLVLVPEIPPVGMTLLAVEEVGVHHVRGHACTVDCQSDFVWKRFLCLQGVALMYTQVHVYAMSDEGEHIYMYIYLENMPNTLSIHCTIYKHVATSTLYSVCLQEPSAYLEYISSGGMPFTSSALTQT